MRPCRFTCSCFILHIAFPHAQTQIAQIHDVDAGDGDGVGIDKEKEFENSKAPVDMSDLPKKERDKLKKKQKEKEKKAAKRRQAEAKAGKRSPKVTKIGAAIKTLLEAERLAIARMQKEEDERGLKMHEKMHEQKDKRFRSKFRECAQHSDVADLLLQQLELSDLRRENGFAVPRAAAPAHDLGTTRPETTEVKVLREMAADTARQQRATERFARLVRFKGANSDGSISAAAATAVRGVNPIASGEDKFTAGKRIVGELHDTQRHLKEAALAAAVLASSTEQLEDVEPTRTPNDVKLAEGEVMLPDGVRATVAERNTCRQRFLECFAHIEGQQLVFQFTTRLRYLEDTRRSLSSRKDERQPDNSKVPDDNRNALLQSTLAAVDRWQHDTSPVAVTAATDAAFAGLVSALQV